MVALLQEMQRCRCNETPQVAPSLTVIQARIIRGGTKKLTYIFYDVDHKKNSLTVETAFFQRELNEFLVSFVGRAVDKNSRVEAVWPTHVWGGRQLFPFE